MVSIIRTAKIKNGKAVVFLFIEDFLNFDTIFAPFINNLDKSIKPKDLGNTYASFKAFKFFFNLHGNLDYIQAKFPIFPTDFLPVKSKLLFRFITKYLKLTPYFLQSAY